MKIKTAFFAFFSMVLVGSFMGSGCGKNDCEDASDRLAAKYDECGITTEDGGDGGGAEVECSDALGAQLQCTADCADAAACGAFDGSDLDALASYGECASAC
ncbi:MAG: hypothetical protein KC636_09900 [Myxococcales bacterium]|nr:hypothetical protein [Myxococcales bacterium]